MKVIKVDLKDREDIEILPLADLHIGSKECDIKLIKETIDYIKNTPHVYTILNGDIIDNTLINSVGVPYDNDLQPMEQLKTAIDLLEPIKDKILVVTAGNHEIRTTKQTNIDLMWIVSKQLGLVDRYAQGFWYLYVYFGEKKSGRKAPMVYTISGYHGSGGGRTAGAKANRLVDMSNIAVADLYIMSHTHMPMSTKKCIFVPDYANKALTLKEMHYMMTNSFLDYGGYGEAAAFHPSSKTLVKAKLNSKKREIQVTI